MRTSGRPNSWWRRSRECRRAARSSRAARRDRIQIFSCAHPPERSNLLPERPARQTRKWRTDNRPASLITMAEQQFFVGIHGVIASRGRILVLKRAPVMIYRPGSWDLPGGHIALGESFEDC